MTYKGIQKLLSAWDDQQNMLKLLDILFDNIMTPTMSKKKFIIPVNIYYWQVLSSKYYIKKKFPTLYVEKVISLNSGLTIKVL